MKSKLEAIELYSILNVNCLLDDLKMETNGIIKIIDFTSERKHTYVGREVISKRKWENDSKLC